MRKPHDFKQHPEPFQTGAYRGVVKHVTDGDTLDVFIDLGFLQYAYLTVRLRKIDTPEIFRPGNEEERRRGQEAKAFVEQLLLDKPVMVVPYKDATSFGRFVADIIYFGPGGVWWDLGDAIREAGLEKLPTARIVPK